jgi:hypothetical protein
MRTPVRSLAALAITVSVALSACSSSGNGSSTANTNSKDVFCGLLLSFRATIDSLADDVNSGDPSSLKDVLQRMVSQAGVLQERAPEDIKPDVDTYASFITQVDALFAGKGYDITAIEGDEQAAGTFAELNSDSVDASLEQLRAYADQDCAAAPTTT